MSEDNVIPLAGAYDAIPSDSEPVPAQYMTRAEAHRIENAATRKLMDNAVGGAQSAKPAKRTTGTGNSQKAIQRAPTPQGALPVVRRERGRPTTYSREIADELLERISSGETVTKACEELGITKSAALNWVTDNRDGFADRYRRARENFYDAMAEHLLHLSDVGTGDVHRDRLASDNRKWLLARLAAHKYGDKMQVTADVSINTQDTKALEAKLAALLARLNPAEPQE